MKKLIFAGLGIAVFAISGLAQGTQSPASAPAPTPKATPAPFTTSLKVGDMAPDFTLPDLKGQKIKLSDFRGKSNVVLAFYVFAFTGG
jgi:peroxiredoxin (alkyl hydroperoxide reductase subunit C)